MVFYVKINNSNSEEVNEYKIFTQKKPCTKFFNFQDSQHCCCLTSTICKCNMLKIATTLLGIWIKILRHFLRWKETTADLTCLFASIKRGAPCKSSCRRAFSGNALKELAHNSRVNSTLSSLPWKLQSIQMALCIDKLK